MSLRSKPQEKKCPEFTVPTEKNHLKGRRWGVGGEGLEPFAQQLLVREEVGRGRRRRRNPQQSQQSSEAAGRKGAAALLAVPRSLAAVSPCHRGVTKRRLRPAKAAVPVAESKSRISLLPSQQRNPWLVEVWARLGGALPALP